MKKTLYWEARKTPVELREMLKELGKYYRIRKGRGAGVALEFQAAAEDGVCEVELSDGAAVVSYSTPAQAGRAVGALLSGLVSKGNPYRETTPLTTLGVMLDCSRNAVMTVDNLKSWFRRLSLLGYNMAMLYTEDTYELPGEPYFGYQRGAYTEKELRAVVAYAAKLNIEIIPCIQTLGHCGQFLRHPAYSDIRDVREVMLVGEKKTYALIDKMVRHWKKLALTDRIHVGMDETHGLGTGKYRELHGERNPFDIFNEHLGKVVNICKKHGLKPMIWSDMYFRLGSKTNTYYDEDCVIPERVIKKIHKDAELVYWDYYHKEKGFYLEWIKRHRAMGKEPVVGSGIWTWNKYWHDRHMTETTAGPCIEACYESKVRELFFTQWGDNGAYCDHDSAFAGMTWCAEKAYGVKTPSSAALEKRFGAVCGGSYKAHSLASDIHKGVDGMQPVMWGDPFFEQDFRWATKESPMTMTRQAKHFASLAAKLKPFSRNKETGSLKYAYSTAKAFADRYALAAKILPAYRKKDKSALRRLAKEIRRVQRSVRTMADAFREMWMSHNKPQGIETIQARFGMIDARYTEMARRVDEYLKGEVDSIPELDWKSPPAS